jgi:hypothetical protein
LIKLSNYYEEKLYPLQDGVLRLIAALDTDFFLTGGTALSRAYYGHRYSDDLDFFATNLDAFDEQADLILAKLKEAGFFWDEHTNALRNARFITFEISSNRSDALLKIDFVNDSAPRFGKLKNSSIFPKVDCPRNILSNKLSALFRSAGKDVADIREIARHETFNWPDIINEGREKDAGLELPLLCTFLETVPESAITSLNWREAAPSWEAFRKDLETIVRDMINCGENSLATFCAHPAVSN